MAPKRTANTWPGLTESHGAHPHMSARSCKGVLGVRALPCAASTTAAHSRPGLYAQLYACRCNVEGAPAYEAHSTCMPRPPACTPSAAQPAASPAKPCRPMRAGAHRNSAAATPVPGGLASQVKMSTRLSALAELSRSWCAVQSACRSCSGPCSALPASASSPPSAHGRAAGSSRGLGGVTAQGPRPLSVPCTRLPGFACRLEQSGQMWLGAPIRSLRALMRNADGSSRSWKTTTLSKLSEFLDSRCERTHQAT